MYWMYIFIHQVLILDEAATTASAYYHCHSIHIYLNVENKKKCTIGSWYFLTQYLANTEILLQLMCVFAPPGLLTQTLSILYVKVTQRGTQSSSYDKLTSFSFRA